MDKFVVKETKTGFTFRLVAGNGETIGTSEVYSGKEACLKGIEGVKRAVETAGFEDQTVPDYEIAVHPKFELYEDKAGEFRFRLKARNGEVVLASEGYKAKASCKKGIESVIKNVLEAEVEQE